LKLGIKDEGLHYFYYIFQATIVVWQSFPYDLE
jgi:hypothetical protein